MGFPVIRHRSFLIIIRVGVKVDIEQMLGSHLNNLRRIHLPSKILRSPYSGELYNRPRGAGLFESLRSTAAKAMREVPRILGNAHLFSRLFQVAIEVSFINSCNKEMARGDSATYQPPKDVYGLDSGGSTIGKRTESETAKMHPASRSLRRDSLQYRQWAPPSTRTPMRASSD